MSFDPNQPRAENGEWVQIGGGGKHGGKIGKVQGKHFSDRQGKPAVLVKTEFGETIGVRVSKTKSLGRKMSRRGR